MCGRYTCELEFSQLRLAFDAVDETFRPFKPTYNISPCATPGHEQLLVSAATSGQRRLRLGRFWLIPSWWSKPLSALPTQFNARAEHLASKPTWAPSFATSRCLIPATGWREFKGPRGRKQPYHFSLGGEVFAFAGIASLWTSPSGESVESFAIVTTQPSPQAAAIHDRMPLIISREHYDRWLDPSQEGGPTLLQAELESSARRLVIFPTNPLGNNTRSDGPEVVAPLQADGAGQASSNRRSAMDSEQQLELPLK